MSEWKMRVKSLTLLMIGTLLFSAIIPASIIRIGSQSTKLMHIILDSISEPLTLDPAWCWDVDSSKLLMNIYETLISFNKSNPDEFAPLLADEWNYTPIDETSPEGLHWVGRIGFHLRTDKPVYFHDAPESSWPDEGEQLTLEDIEYSFERSLITDSAIGPAWMLHELLHGGYSMDDLNYTLTTLGWPINPTTGWNTKCDEVIDHAIETGGGWIWFNMNLPKKDIMCQIVAQPWCGILSKTWCTTHLVSDFPATEETGDNWFHYHDPETSPIDAQSTAGPGPHLDAALGTGPYMLDYWNKGAGNAWSIRANREDIGYAVSGKGYWRGWAEKHLDRFSSYDIPEWTTRKQRFLGYGSDITHIPTMCIDEIRTSKTGGRPEVNYEQYLTGVTCDWGTWDGTTFTPYVALSCDAVFFNLLVSNTSTRMGEIQPPGMFKETGAPVNFFNDTKTRLAFTHLFDYAEYLETAYLNESISPVTPIITGLTPAPPSGWPSIGEVENPTTNQRKEYGVSFEPAGQKACDLVLAVKYLKEAWGGSETSPGPLWITGFTIDLVSLDRLWETCSLIKDAIEWINTNYGTKFHTNLVTEPWSKYREERNARKLPFFISGWLADYADAHDFAYTFMHSRGAAGTQGYIGITEFPNKECDEHVEAAVNTTNVAERIGNYTWLEQYYVDKAPGFVLNQPILRHWRKLWVKGWSYNPMKNGMHYAYDLWNLADYDGDSDIDYDDIVSFVTAYIVYLDMGTKDPACDFDGDCDIDYGDIQTFVDAYIAYWTP